MSANSGRQGRRRRPAGGLDRLPSGRWRARFNSPNGERLSSTFPTKSDADAWLAQQATLVREGRFVNPNMGKITLAEYAQRWLEGRHDLRPRTRELYAYLLRRYVLPPLGTLELSSVQPAIVRRWHQQLTSPAGPGYSTAAKSYRLLRTIMRVAVDDELIVRSPCVIRGGGIERTPERPVASIAQVQAAAETMPPRFRLIVLLASWCGLRRGELLGLERRDVDLAAGTLRVERTRSQLTNGEVIVGPPKTDAGRRTIAVPPHLVADLASHLDQYVRPDPTSLVFTGEKGGPLRPHVLQHEWEIARRAVGLGHLHLHDLRHSGNTWTASTGASTAELMVRMGHASPQAALRYQHATRDRDVAIARALSELAHRSAGNTSTGGVAGTDAGVRGPEL